MKFRALGCAAVVVSLAACGGDESGGSVGDLEDAYESYTSALFGGDGEAAYEYLSLKCQDATDLGEVVKAADLSAEVYGDVKVEILESDVDGDKGMVNGEYGIPALDEGNEKPGYEWVYENSEWRFNKCP